MQRFWGMQISREAGNVQLNGFHFYTVCYGGFSKQVLQTGLWIMV